MCKYYKYALVALLLLTIVLTSCSNKPISNIEVTKTKIVLVTPTIINTSTPAPYNTPIPTKIPATKASKGLVKTPLNEGEYVVLQETEKFPYLPFSVSGFSFVEDIGTKMFNNAKFTEEGFEITTGENDIIIITNSEFVGDRVFFHFLKNGKKYATIDSDVGTLLVFNTFFPDAENYDYSGIIMWGTYDPTNQVFLDRYKISNNLYQTPMALGSIWIDENWIPQYFEPRDLYNLCNPNNFWIATSKLTTNQITYQLKNDDIYLWGPPPLPCPTAKITYY